MLGCWKNGYEWLALFAKYIPECELVEDKRENVHQVKSE
jgi:hypothetical protein